MSCGVVGAVVADAGAGLNSVITVMVATAVATRPRRFAALVGGSWRNAIPTSSCLYERSRADGEKEAAFCATGLLPPPPPHADPISHASSEMPGGSSGNSEE